ncbi:MAG TPA: hypothetical protein VFQ70_02375 [Candidatus Saccharimonadaceae bacterium]|nr:hypothetical protein [Candidatus Saccharimonadaceae bacterium]
MASERGVRGAIIDVISNSPTRRIQAKTIGDLKCVIGADGMRTLWLQQILATMQHGREIRGFSLTRGTFYIQG